jgi:importin subunit alpha-1
LSNTTSGGSPEQIRYLVQQGCIKPLCDLLTCSDARIITVALEGLENILKIGEKDAKSVGGLNQYSTLIEEAEGLDKIEQLQNHQNNDIYEKAVKILELYFGGEEEDSSIAPPMDANQQTYQFGANVPQGGFNF